VSYYCIGSMIVGDGVQVSVVSMVIMSYVITWTDTPSWR